jgi:hypothetical protein
MRFGNSIGGGRGSSGIDGTSISLSQASGGPVGGYTPSKGWGAQGAPTHRGENRCGPMPTNDSRHPQRPAGSGKRVV